MSRTNCTKEYHHLTIEKRIKLEALLNVDMKKTKIMEELGCSRTTIYNEIKRNGEPNKNKTRRVNKPSILNLDLRHTRGSVFNSEVIEARERYQKRRADFEKNKAKYNALRANKRAILRKQEAGRKANPRKLDLTEYQSTLNYIDQHLDDWSPELIHLRLAIEEEDNSVLKGIDTVTIYRYIYQVKPEWKKRLVRRGKRYKIKESEVYNRTNRHRHHIKDRPDDIGTILSKIDLEGDSIVGKDKKDRILTHNRPLTGLCALEKIIGFNADNIGDTTIKSINRVFGSSIRTITYDNGVEFSAWKRTEKKLKNTTIYFADPYSPWQRGSNENLNGLVRRYIPKGTDLKKLSNDDIMRIETILNNRPRKFLGGLTPLEAEDGIRFAQHIFYSLQMYNLG